VSRSARRSRLDRAQHPPARLPHVAAYGHAIGRRDQLGGGRGRGRAHVGRKVREREVDLVAHRRDDRKGRSGDRAYGHFLVERPQIFERTAAAPDDQDVEPAQAIEAFDRPGDRGRGALALHRDRREHNAQSGPAPV